MLSLLTFALDQSDLEYLHQVAHEVTAASRVSPFESISKGNANATGVDLRVPGGTRNYYPAFWIRDASMMLGADLIPLREVQGWIKVVASTQPGPSGLSFDHQLRIPAYSIPDHITLGGKACWFPGAYAEQGVGDYGHLPPADDSFYFIQMVWEEQRMSKEPKELSREVQTGWGERPLWEVCAKAFESVGADSKTGLVVCSSEENTGRVDWGFCDSITKTGSCLMPSLLRLQAAQRLSRMYRSIGKKDLATEMNAEAEMIRRSIIPAFFVEEGRGDSKEGALLSSTGVGRKDDLWATAFAIWMGILPRTVEQKLARHLLRVYQEDGAVLDGQVREMPLHGQFGGNWDQAKSTPGTYQNGGYWATPTGWYVSALRKVDQGASAKLLHEYASFVRSHRNEGAPFEWINPNENRFVNANYGSSAGLVYIAAAGR